MRVLSLLIIHLAVFLLVSAPAVAGAAEPAGDMSRCFDEMVGLMSSGEEWNVADWARASYLAARLSSFGGEGVPFAKQRFLGARREEEAFLAGLYTGAFGLDSDHQVVKKALESSDQPRRRWLQAMVGTPQALEKALREGAAWQPATQLIPGLDRCRKLCLACLQSQDALVRRAALYWGFWIGGEAYWRQAAACAKNDTDALTQRFAARLLRERSRRQ